MQQNALYAQEKCLHSQRCQVAETALSSGQQTKYIYSDFLGGEKECFLSYCPLVNKSKALMFMCMCVKTETNRIQATAFVRTVTLLDFGASGRIRSFEIWYQFENHS